MKKWMAQAEKASAIKKWMASRYSSLQIKWHTTLKVVIWEVPTSGDLRKNIKIYKNISLQKFDVSATATQKKISATSIPK